MTDLENVLAYAHTGGHVVLFLDYDGTLVPIAPTPSEAVPDRDLLDLLTALTRAPRLRTVIVSGRPLKTLQLMLPIPGLILAGLYGTEVLQDGHLLWRGMTIAECRPVMIRIASAWSALIDGRAGFLLEDKERAIALHARWALPGDSEFVLNAARRRAGELIDASRFRILGGDRFLEVAPSNAHKGEAVEWFLNQPSEGNDLPVYFGDDDKDEVAFQVVQRWGGLAVGVGARFPLLEANARIGSPSVARAWLREILAAASVPYEI